jgi:tRNA-Thr(GGU) m(6)t(6)A37 methyltransferase TsaA
MPSESVFLRPIGTVRNGVTEGGGVRWEKLVSSVEVDERYLPALQGIEAFSHIIVLFHFDRLALEAPTLQIRPEGRPEMPLVGLFATRSPRRPNPVGLTVVELLERKENVLTVRGLDALDGTPVLDLKPYLPRGDQVQPSRLPEWLRQLWAAHDEEWDHG